MINITDIKQNNPVCCDYHNEGMDHVNGFIILASVRAQQDLYKAKPFVFCPWCGKDIRLNKRG